MLFYERCLPEHLKKQNSLSDNSTLSKLSTILNHDAERNVESVAMEVTTMKTKKKDETDTNEKQKIRETDETDDDEQKMTKKAKKAVRNRNCKKETSRTKITEAELDSDGEFIDVPSTSTASSLRSRNADELESMELIAYTRPQLNKDLEDWIWQDNRQFLQDRNIFEHTYFK